MLRLAPIVQTHCMHARKQGLSLFGNAVHDDPIDIKDKLLTLVESLRAGCVLCVQTKSLHHAAHSCTTHVLEGGGRVGWFVEHLLQTLSV